MRPANARAEGRTGWQRSEKKLRPARARDIAAGGGERRKNFAYQTSGHGAERSYCGEEEEEKQHGNSGRGNVLTPRHLVRKKIVNHKGHGGALRKTLSVKAYVILRGLGGCSGLQVVESRLGKC